MTGVWALASLWLGLALIASLFSIWFRISTALSEIVVGTIAQLIIGAAVGSAVLGTDESWVKFLSGIGAIVLTFLAGAELDPVVFRLKWKEAAAVGLVELLFPISGLRGRRPLSARMGGDAELARRRRHVDHFGRRGLCGDDRVRLQHHRIRQDRSGRLFRHRPRHRRGAGPHLCAVHDEDAHLPRRWHGGLRGSALADAAVLPHVWRPAFGTGDEVSAALPAWDGRAWPPGPTAKRCFQPISSAWCLPEPSARTMRWSGGCAR